MRNLKNTVKKTMKYILFAMVMFATMTGALAEPVSAFGFTAFGWHIGTEGINRAESAHADNGADPGEASQSQEQSQAMEHHNSQGDAMIENEHKSGQGQSQEREQEQNGEMVNAQEAIHAANSNAYAVSVMKGFDGDNFCIETEERIAYATISTDGQISLQADQPEDCYHVKTTEMHLSKVWERAQNNERMSYGEVTEGMKIPFSLRAKLAWAGLTSRFS